MTALARLLKACRPGGKEAQDGCISQKGEILNGTWFTFHIKLSQSIFKSVRVINWTSPELKFVYSKCWTPVYVGKDVFCVPSADFRESSEEKRWIAWGSYPLTSAYHAGSCTSLTFAFMRILEEKLSVPTAVRRTVITGETAAAVVCCMLTVSRCHYSWLWLLLLTHCYLFLFIIILVFINLLKPSGNFTYHQV
jgi:hypothetical protein